jgi:primosomal protein N' (replication factor Y)
VRSNVVGARRTAEELGRAFPGVPVHTSGAGEVLSSVSGKASLVIATPGAEPVAENGYAATLLLDAWASLDRPTLDASEEALRRWLAAAALTQGAAQGGITVLCGAPMHTTLPLVEALVRWDPAWFAARELAERVELALPPAVRMAQLVGTRVAVQRGLEMAALDHGVEQLGPLPWVPAGRSSATGDTAAMSSSQDAPKIQLLLRAGLDDGPALTAALTRMKALRSARKERETVSVRVDPMDGLG